MNLAGGKHCLRASPHTRGRYMNFNGIGNGPNLERTLGYLCQRIRSEEVMYSTSLERRDQGSSFAF